MEIRHPEVGQHNHVPDTNVKKDKPKMFILLSNK